MSKEMKILPELRFPEFDRASEWQLQPLRKVLIKNSKKNKSLKHNLVQSVSNKHGFINQEDYFDNRRVASKDTSNYYVIKKGYFAYNPSRIDVGSLAYQHENITSIISPLYVSFQANYEEVDDIFLLNWFFSDQFSSQLIFEGGVRNTLSFENLVQINITLPSIPEQQKIASCLSSLDELIAAHKDKLDALKDHKKGLLQNLFPQEGETVPKVRFPDFEGDGEWVEDTLHNLASFSKGKGISKADIVENGKTPCIRYGELYTQYNETIGEVVSYTNLDPSDLVLSDANDVIIPASGETQIDIATASCVLKPGIALGGDLNIIKTEINGVFLAYYLNSAKKKDIAQIAQGISVVHLYSRQLKTLTVNIPSIQEQQKIASCLSAVDELITAQQQKIEQLQQHKKGLMQGLFPKIDR